MKIPKKINICGDIVSVEILSKFPKRYKDCLGLCMVPKKKILLKKNKSWQKLKQIFIHEILEYVLQLLDCTLERPHKEDKYLMGHTDLDVIARVISGVF